MATRLLTIHVITTDSQLKSLLVSSRDVCANESILNVTLGYNTIETNSRVLVADSKSRNTMFCSKLVTNLIEDLF